MSSFDLIMEEGKRFMREGQYPFAEKSLEAAVCLNEGNANLWFELGKACYLQEKHLKAVAALKKSLSLDGGNLNALLLLAKSYKESRAYKEAIGSFKELLEKGFTGENLHRELADLYRTLGKFDRAAEELKKAFESGYDEKEYLSALGNTYRDLIKSVQLCNMEGDVSKALELAGKAQNIIPKNQRMYQNILLNEKEIACREINLESEVRSLTVTLTNRCNLACLMCQTRLIPWDVPEKTRKEIISLFPVLERVMWQGGEAFLYDGFKELLQEAGRYPLRNVIVTNGALITEELAELMVKGNVELTFSIDGATKEVYEHVRRGARFERVLESIGMINAFRKKHNPGMQLRLNVLVMEANVHQLEAFLDFAKEHSFNTIFYNSTGCDFTNEKENIFLYRNEKALQDMQKAKVRLHKKANEYGLRLEDWLPSVDLLEKETGLCRTENPAFPGKPEIFKTEQIGRKRVPLPEEPSPGKCVKKLLCHAPWQRLYIDCGGEVRPDCLCVHEQIAGKVPENSLREIWNGKRLKEYRQRIVRENCRDFCKLDCLIGRVPEKNLKFV